MRHPVGQRKRRTELREVSLLARLGNTLGGFFVDRVPSDNQVGQSQGINISGLNLAAGDAKVASDKATTIVGVFPVPNMTNVGLGEFLLDNTGKPIRVGSLILVQMPDTTNPVVTTFTLRKEGVNFDVPVRVHESAGTPMGSDESNPGEPTFAGWAIMFTTVALEANSKYTVNFAGTYKGNPIAKTWSFTTGSSVSAKIAD